MLIAKWKSVLFLLLLLMVSCTVLTACGDGEAAGNEGGDSETVTEAVETEPPFDATPLTDYSFGTVNDSAIAYLVFDGDKATLTAVKDGSDTSVSGTYTVDESKLTIDGTEFTYRLTGNYLVLETEETKFNLTKTTESSKAKIESIMTMITSSWSGAGASLSFSGAEAALKLDDAGVDYKGIYKMSTSESLLVKNSSIGDPTNLALNCDVEVTSLESGQSYVGELAVDGDLSTRWSSDYVDPSSIVIDLGENKNVGAVRLNFEAAYSIEYKILVSTDNENWTEVVHVTDNSTANAFLEHEFAKQSARYVKFEGYSRGTTYGHSLYEIEVYEQIIGEASMTVALEGDQLKLVYNGTEYTLTKQ